MSYDPSIRVIKGSEQETLDWEVIPTAPEDPNPPGEEVVSFRSGDAVFSFGLWKRAPETGPMDLSGYHEIAVIIEGEVEIHEEDGTIHRVGPGDAGEEVLGRLHGAVGREREGPTRGSGERAPGVGPSARARTP